MEIFSYGVGLALLTYGLVDYFSEAAENAMQRLWVFFGGELAESSAESPVMIGI